MKNKDVFNTKFNAGKEIWMTIAGIFLTLIASWLVCRDVAQIFDSAYQTRNFHLMAEQGVFFLIVISLIYGNLLYQITRIGYFRRLSRHQPAAAHKVDALYQNFSAAPSLTILIPSYKEETRIVRQTLLSAALQSYPKKRVVLLVDDPPNPQTPQDINTLTAVRRLPHDIQDLFRPMALKYKKAQADFLAKKERPADLRQEHHQLIFLFEEVIRWFETAAALCPVQDHTDKLFIEMTYRKRVVEYQTRVQALEDGLTDASRLFSEKEIEREYCRLAAVFDVELSSFERKTYENLSHESNKAMNLNSYIGLMGKSFEEVDRHDAVHLEPSNAPHAKHYADSDYLITLDADSLLDSDYALRLVYFMEEPANKKFAVIQTPYSAVPDPDGVVERISGATTDMQYLIHQGFTCFNATYWVGANALIRKKALEDIKVTEVERGFTITKYIQDRTVIEDTESSIDLVYSGWKLYNFPERLSYSATPPDFGSLLIQRRRWANGGLIILPKFIRYFFKSLWTSNPIKKIAEGFMRFHYLFSIAAVNLGVLTLLLYPFESNMRCFWLPMTALPYYFFYGRDLFQAGYSLLDLFRVYVMNLFLIPVNLGGVFKSIHQAISGHKIPFGRTPKIQGKTLAPAPYVWAECLIFGYALVNLVLDIAFHRWLHAFFSAVTMLCFLYAGIHFMGWEEIRYAFMPQKKSSKKMAGRPHSKTAKEMASSL